jgi:hypothetical protein
LKVKSNALPAASLFVWGLLSVWPAHLPGLRKGVFPDYQFAGVLKQLLLKL